MEVLREERSRQNDGCTHEHVSILVLMEVLREVLAQPGALAKFFVSILVLMEVLREALDPAAYLAWGRKVSILVLMEVLREVRMRR